MEQSPLQLAVVIGSTRAGRFGPIVANWFVQQARGHDDVVVDVVDLLDTPIDDGTFAKHIDKADAVVLVTPEYNHSFPGPLKSAIDSAHGEWRAKPVAFVSYGGISGGLRAVHQLRNVFPELRAMTVRETVSFHQASTQFDDEGRPVHPDAVNQAATILLDELAWWGYALRQARHERPYA